MRRDRRCLSGRRLSEWRRQGWLSTKAHGTGTVYDWTDPEVAAQIGWLRRVAGSGRVLDDEDAAAGFRLRAAGWPLAVRVDDGAWVGVATVDIILAAVDGVWTVAYVNGPAEVAA